jgi:hypothetical protein
LQETKRAKGAKSYTLQSRTPLRPLSLWAEPNFKALGGVNHICFTFARKISRMCETNLTQAFGLASDDVSAVPSVTVNGSHRSLLPNRKKALEVHAPKLIRRRYVGNIADVLLDVQKATIGKRVPGSFARRHARYRAAGLGRGREAAAAARRGLQKRLRCSRQ